MALKYTQTVIALQKLLTGQSASALAEIIKVENDNASALIVALCEPDTRSDILVRLTPARRLKIVQSLSSLKQPPDFVIQVVLESLRTKL